MLNLAIAAAILIALWAALRWFSTVPAAQVRRGLKWAGLAALVGLGLFLVLTGRLAGLVAVAAGLMPWVFRALRLHALYRLLKQFGIRMKGGQASPGASSTVETRFVRMSLDHDTGHLDGEVLEGPLRGRRLSQLGMDEGVALLRAAALDPQSAQVIEAWLERTFPDWRDHAGASSAPPPRAGAAMSREEAYEVLGLAPGAAPEAVKAAHRRLMLANHPDHGGSDWIASRLNQARDILLG